MTEFKFKRNILTASVSLALLAATSTTVFANPDIDPNDPYQGLAVYLDDYAINPTETLKVRVSLPANSGDATVEPAVTCVGDDFSTPGGDPGTQYTIDVLKVTGTGTEFISTSATGAAPNFILNNGVIQALPANPWKNSLGWTGAVDVDIPGENWKSGVYKLLIKLGGTPAGQDDCDTRVVVTTFVVNPEVTSDKKILLIDNLYSKAAASDFGDKSLKLFNNASNPNATDTEININRPMGQNLELIRAASWLDSKYSDKYDVLSIEELDTGTIRTSYDVVVVSGDNAVWTDAGRAKLDTYLASGGNVVMLGGQTMFWRATRTGSNLRVAAGDHSLRTRALSAGGVAENSTTGVSFRHAGLINAPDIRTLPSLNFKALDHWVYTGSGVAAGTDFGSNIDNGTATFSLAGPQTSGTPVTFSNNVPSVVPGSSGSPANFEIIAFAEVHNIFDTVNTDPNDGGLKGFATPGLFKTSNGGYVFNAATASWGRALWNIDTEALPSKDEVQVVTKNVLDVLLSTGGVAADADEDGIPDAIDNEDNTPTVDDADGDTILDAADNCPAIANLDQLDTDDDGAGNVCDVDDDGDGVNDLVDAFPLDDTKFEADVTEPEPDTDTPATTAKKSSGGGAMSGLLLLGLSGLAAIRRRTYRVK